MSYCSINFCDKSASRFRDGAEYCQLHFDQLNEIAAAEHGFYIAERNLARYYFTADYDFYKQEFNKLEKHYRHLKRQLAEKQDAWRMMYGPDPFVLSEDTLLLKQIEKQEFFINDKRENVNCNILSFMELPEERRKEESRNFQLDLLQALFFIKEASSEDRDRVFTRKNNIFNSSTLRSQFIVELHKRVFQEHEIVCRYLTRIDRWANWNEAVFFCDWNDIYQRIADEIVNHLKRENEEFVRLDAVTDEDYARLNPNHLMTEGVEEDTREGGRYLNRLERLDNTKIIITVLEQLQTDFDHWLMLENYRFSQEQAREEQVYLQEQAERERVRQKENEKQARLKQEAHEKRKKEQEKAAQEDKTIERIKNELERQRALKETKLRLLREQTLNAQAKIDMTPSQDPNEAKKMTFIINTITKLSSKFGIGLKP
jgi:hypothetical protein